MGVLVMLAEQPEFKVLTINSFLWVEFSSSFTNVKLGT